jgi:hypothetical protein
MNESDPAAIIEALREEGAAMERAALRVLARSLLVNAYLAGHEDFADRFDPIEKAAEKFAEQLLEGWPK